MLQKPDVPDALLIACLREAYGLHTAAITFLPLGNDVDTAVYRVVADDGTPYFLKLRGWSRSGRFDPASVTIPHFLHTQGIAPIIAPIPTRTGALWAMLDRFAVVLFPFVEGQNGFARPLSERQWIALGAALRGVHTVTVPPALRAAIPQEQYASHWRHRATALQMRVAEESFTQPIAAQMAAILRGKHAEIALMVARAGALADTLRVRPPELVLCHADIHAGNVLIDTHGVLHIVDWDTPIFAPKERDLMFIGGGIGGAWKRAREEALFFQGYGPTTIDPLALAYYRYERIIEDIVEYGERLLLGGEGGADRAVGLGKFAGQFDPGNVVEIAHRTDQASGAGARAGAGASADDRC